MEFEKFETASQHDIISRNVMVESETGRVVAVFYNEYDMDDVLEQLKDEDHIASVKDLRVQIKYLKQQISNLEYQLWESIS